MACSDYSTSSPAFDLARFLNFANLIDENLHLSMSIDLAFKNDVLGVVGPLISAD